jgi:hypothetical protein
MPGVNTSLVIFLPDITDQCVLVDPLSAIKIMEKNAMFVIVLQNNAKKMSLPKKFSIFMIKNTLIYGFTLNYFIYFCNIFIK